MLAAVTIAIIIAASLAHPSAPIISSFERGVTG